MRCWPFHREGGIGPKSITRTSEMAKYNSRVLLFSLPDGILGEQTAQLLGQLIVSRLQLATFSRMDIEKTDRRPFYLYLDEFQTYIGVAETSYSKLHSRGRKYAFGLILAHQNTSQITKEILDNIL